MEAKEGYITDIEYVHGVYRELGPSALNLVLLIQSLEPIALEQGFTYCDLGCGQGESVNLFAACHPEGEFHGIDFNAAHIEGARALARQAELDNITFWEASFADLGALGLPDFDFVVLHGIFSWVGDENRRLVLEFLRTKLKPGGVVFLSYNSLPGWSLHAPLRQLLSSYAETLTGPLEQRVDESLAFVGRLKEAEASVFARNPSSAEFFDYICTLPRNYVAHEFFNRHWTLFYHAEMVRDLAAANLSFVGSASFAENQEMLRFSVAQKQILDGVHDRVMRETLKDFCLSPLLRRDVFVRGPRTITATRQMEHFSRCRFALVVSPAKLERKALFPIGEVLFEAELYDPIISALELKPHNLQELLQREEIWALGLARVTEALMVLLSAQYVMPAVEPTPRALVATTRLNAALLEREVNNLGQQSLASPLLQSAIKSDWLERLLIICEINKSADPLPFIWGQMEARRHKLTRDGVILQTEEENLAELVAQMKSFRSSQLPLLRQLAIVPALDPLG
jgi:SAM-dependent methyltransferase